MSPALKACLLDPVEHDPLSFAASDCMLELARQRNQPLVAWLTDSTFAVSKKGITVKEFLANTQAEAGGLKFEELGGWIVARPIDPVAARREHIDRPALRRFAQAMDAKGSVRLVDYAELAASSESDQPSGLVATWMLLQDPFSATLSVQWNTARLYGLLSDEVRRSLQRGGTVRFDRLSAAQKQRFEEMAYASGEVLRLARGADASMVGFESLFEPTTLFPRGVPADAELALEVRSNAIPVAYRLQDDGSTRPFMFAGVSRIASLEHGGEPIPGLAGFATGTTNLVTLRFLYGSDLKQGFGMTVYDVDGKAKPVPWNELPDPFPEQIRKYMSAMRPPPAPGIAPPAN